MSEWVYIGAAYGLTWATLIAYGLYVWSRGSRAAEAWDAIVRKTGEER